MSLAARCCAMRNPAGICERATLVRLACCDASAGIRWRPDTAPYQQASAHLARKAQRRRRLQLVRQPPLELLVLVHRLGVQRALLLFDGPGVVARDLGAGELRGGGAGAAWASDGDTAPIAAQRPACMQLHPLLRGLYAAPQPLPTLSKLTPGPSLARLWGRCGLPCGSFPMTPSALQGSGEMPLMEKWGFSETQGTPACQVGKGDHPTPTLLTNQRSQET